uniref:Defensin-like protein 1 n=1 Tax=Nelumbo nucifera TaxID=4432 RepID=A0A822ZKV2_NELNU|nr:TPA_asm: hypothetical protein HUJ06_003603 [Nelumbo nucifera]
MAKFFGCFFFVLLVLSVVSKLPSSDAAGGRTCVEVQPFGSNECNINACVAWCDRTYNGQGHCQKDGNYNNCLCSYNC